MCESVITAGYIGFVWKALEIAVYLPFIDIGFVLRVDQHNFVKQKRDTLVYFFGGVGILMENSSFDHHSSFNVLK